MKKRKPYNGERYREQREHALRECDGLPQIRDELADKAKTGMPETLAEEIEIDKLILDATNILRERQRAHPRSHSTTIAESLVREPRHRFSTSVRRNGITIE